MAASFFGNVMVTPDSTLSSSSASSTTTATTTLTVQKGSGTYTYAWTVTGTSCTLSNGTTVTPTFTWTGTGTSICYCTVTDSNSNISTRSPDYTITWGRVNITAMTWNLNGVSFTTNQSKPSGTTYTITVASTTPSSATNSPVTASFTAVGGPYTLTSIGTGSYQNSFTSPQLTIAAAISGSITVNSPPSTVTSRNCTATLTGATATSYSWSRISGTVGSIVSPTLQTTNINGSGSTTATFQCTITYSGGSVSPTLSITWNQV